MKIFVSTQMYVRGNEVTKKVAHGKNHKHSENLVKLPYLAHKEVPRALTILVFVLIFTMVQWFRLGHKCLTALPTLTEARIKYPRYIGKAKVSTNFFT